MKKTIILISLITILTISGIAAEKTITINPIASPTPTTEKVKKPTFRATKEQVTQAQKMLKEKGIYAGEADGKMNPKFRTAVKSYQKENGLRQSGSLNRATLEKMGIALTDKQKQIEINPNDFATNGANNSGTTKKRGPVFRATKEQIMEAQKKLKDGGMYSGEQTGKLNPEMREALKKYQTANGLKVTGTLNAATLEKMGIPLTDKQKEIVANSQ